MNWRKIVITFMIVTTLVILGFDAYAIYQGGIEVSISSLTTEYAHKYPVIAFAWGFLMGHFFG